MLQTELNLNIVDTVFDPNSSNKVVYYKLIGNRQNYKVRLKIEGEDLPYIKYVTYELHQTFSKPIHTIWRTASNPNCELVIWTWGLFDVRIKIKKKTGEVQELLHPLKYDMQIHEKGVRFVQI